MTLDSLLFSSFYGKITVINYSVWFLDTKNLNEACLLFFFFFFFFIKISVRTDESRLLLSPDS